MEKRGGTLISWGVSSDVSLLDQVEFGTLHRSRRSNSSPLLDTRLSGHGSKFRTGRLGASAPAEAVEDV